MKTNRTFAGIPNEYAQLETSNIILIPVPYDGTSTWQKGSDKGPSAFLEAAENMELFDIETESEVYKEGIYLADDIIENSSPDVLVESVYRITKSFIVKNQTSKRFFD